jgi:uncharacterized protein
VAGIYVDTSALGRVVLGEPDAQTIRATLAQFDPWLASELLVVELRRSAAERVCSRRPNARSPRSASCRSHGALLERASRLDPIEVRSLDAIHLCTAVDLHNAGSIAAVLTYDLQLQAGSQHHGIGVEAPVV